MTVSIQRLSAMTLAISTALTLTACGGSEAEFFNNLNGPRPTVSNNSNTAQPASTTTIDQAGTTGNGGTNNSGGTNNQSQGDSSQFTQISEFSFDQAILNNDKFKEIPKFYYAGKTRGNLHDEVAIAYNQVDSEGRSRFETTEGYRATINNRTYRSNESVDVSTLGNGYQNYALQETSVTNIDGKRYTGERASRVQLYQQDNSLVLGRYTVSGQISDGSNPKTLSETDLRIDQLKGKPTIGDDFKTLNTERAYFTYKGQAFTKAGAGDFEYSVDFVDQSGSGKITGLSDKGTINLNQANFAVIDHTNPDDRVISVQTGEEIPNIIHLIGIHGKAHFADGRADGTYTLGFFGNGATEVAGFVTEDNTNTVGFGGKKQ